HEAGRAEHAPLAHLVRRIAREGEVGGITRDERWADGRERLLGRERDRAADGAGLGEELERARRRRGGGDLAALGAVGPLGGRRQVPGGGGGAAGGPPRPGGARGRKRAGGRGGAPAPGVTPRGGGGGPPGGGPPPPPLEPAEEAGLVGDELRAQGLQIGRGK